MGSSSSSASKSLTSLSASASECTAEVLTDLKELNLCAGTKAVVSNMQLWHRSVGGGDTTRLVSVVSTSVSKAIKAAPRHPCVVLSIETERRLLLVEKVNTGVEAQWIRQTQLEETMAAMRNEFHSSVQTEAGFSAAQLLTFLKTEATHSYCVSTDNCIHFVCRLYQIVGEDIPQWLAASYFAPSD